MVTEDKDGICYQRVSLDDVLPGEEQLFFMLGIKKYFTPANAPGRVTE